MCRRISTPSPPSRNAHQQAMACTWYGLKSRKREAVRIVWSMDATPLLRMSPVSWFRGRREGHGSEMSRYRTAPENSKSMAPSVVAVGFCMRRNQICGSVHRKQLYLFAFSENSCPRSIRTEEEECVEVRDSEWRAKARSYLEYNSLTVLLRGREAGLSESG